MADIDEDRESRVRHQATRQSLELVRCPPRDPGHPDRSTYGLVDHGVLVAGGQVDGLGLNLDGVERALREDDQRTGQRTIEVRDDLDHETWSFDDAGTPVLTFGWHAQLGNGWHLWTTRDDVDSGAGNFFGGSLADVDAAVKRAEEHLQRSARQPSSG